MFSFHLSLINNLSSLIYGAKRNKAFLANSFGFVITAKNELKNLLEQEQKRQDEENKGKLLGKKRLNRKSLEKEMKETKNNYKKRKNNGKKKENEKHRNLLN